MCVCVCVCVHASSPGEVVVIFVVDVDLGHLHGHGPLLLLHTQAVFAQLHPVVVALPDRQGAAESTSTFESLGNGWKWTEIYEWD